MPRKTATKAKPQPDLSANEIKNWREHRNLTQEALASQVADYMDDSFTAASLSRIERSRQPYNTRQLDALAFVLRCKPCDLIGTNPFDPAMPLIDQLAELSPLSRKRAEKYLKMLKEEDAENEAT